jgi:hypothetical protein
MGKLELPRRETLSMHQYLGYDKQECKSELKGGCWLRPRASARYILDWQPVLATAAVFCEVELDTAIAIIK